MKKLILWTLLLTLLLCGCGAQKPEQTTAPETTVATEPETEPTTVPTEPPVYRNPLNGEILDEPYTGRIFAHTITNTQDALPHVNAVKADILLECYVSRGVVRYTSQQPSSIRKGLGSPLTVTEVMDSAA